jgi:GPH family glycoside/pentoside/hexuronide:cation symporter
MVITCWYSLFPEISLDQNERLNISKYLQIFGLFGLILGLGIAPMIAGSFPSEAIGYPIMGLVLGIICAIFMVPTILFVKEHKEYQVKEDRAKIEYSVLLLSAFITVIPGLFIWIWIATRKGTKFTLFLSMLCFAVVFPFSFFITNPIIGIVVLLFGGFGLGGLMLLPTILLSDVIDEDQLKTQERREGIFTGVSGVIVKMANAISWGIIGVILTIFLIDRENLSPATLTPFNELGLRILVGVLPVVCIIVGLVFLWRYPLAGPKLAQIKDQVLRLNKEILKED